ncbi:transcriptional regulator [Nissabacter sp. SGAir0207]|nr:transcriptional regulator [Nissabacter sp. SGAir0207]
MTKPHAVPPAGISCSPAEKGREFGGKRHRRERLFDANDIRLMILSILQSRAAHGYEVIKSIEELSKGEYTPSAGVIYPNLTLMEEMGYITASDQQAGKKAYALTAAGQAQLTEHQTVLAAAVGRLHALAVLANNRARPEVQQAINNIRSALNTRLSKEAVSEETLHTIIDALERATRAIERS